MGLPGPIQTGVTPRAVVRTVHLASSAVAAVEKAPRWSRDVTAGRSLKRSQRTTPWPVSTPRTAGPAIVRQVLEEPAQPGGDPTAGVHTGTLSTTPRQDQGRAVTLGPAV